MISISEKAADKIKTLLEQEKKGQEYGLRLGVKGGGCAGMTYLMDFDQAKADDKVYTGKDGVKVYVDPKSLVFINGTTLDYIDALTGAGFTLKNPNAKGSCGCGTSFSV